MNGRKWLAAVVVASMATGTVWAHHAREYIEMESYSTAKKGEFVFHFHYDYMSDEKNDPDLDHWEITPGLSYGITDHLMIDIHTHYAKFQNGHVVEERQAEFEPDGPSPFFEAVAGVLQYRVTQDQFIDVAVSATIEVPFNRSKDLLGSEDNVYAGTLILGKDFEGHRNISINLGYEVEGDEEDFFWAIGAKTPLSSDPHGIAAGVEALGSFKETGDNWSVLPGVYMPLGAPNITLKTGFEIGTADGAETTRANVTLMYRF